MPVPRPSFVPQDAPVSWWSPLCPAGNSQVHYLGGTVQVRRFDGLVDMCGATRGFARRASVLWLCVGDLVVRHALGFGASVWEASPARWPWRRLGPLMVDGLANRGEGLVLMLSLPSAERAGGVCGVGSQAVVQKDVTSSGSRSKHVALRLQDILIGDGLAPYTTTSGSKGTQLYAGIHTTDRKAPSVYAKTFAEPRDLLRTTS